MKELISRAHYNLTKKKGRPSYAPNFHEIQEEINKLVEHETKNR